MNASGNRVQGRPPYLCIGLLGLLAGIAWCVRQGYSRTTCERMHLEIVGKQLACLRSYLADFRRQHGRYPSNDEGLAALDTFKSRFKGYFCDAPSSVSYRLARLGPKWESLRERVQAFRQSEGRLPRDVDELMPGTCLPAQPDGPAIELEFGIGTDDNVFLLSRAGVLTPWRTPYVYENRTGLAAAAFTDSPVSQDSTGDYSIKVDDGVYVYSVDAQLLAEQISRAVWTARASYAAGALLVLAAILLIIVRLRGLGLRLAGVAIGGAAFAAMPAVTMTSLCYAVSPLFSRRDPAAGAAQKRRLDKYRAAGVISEPAYRRAVDGLEPDKVVTPTTRPG